MVNKGDRGAVHSYAFQCIKVKKDFESAASASSAIPARVVTCGKSSLIDDLGLGNLPVNLDRFPPFYNHERPHRG